MPVLLKSFLGRKVAKKSTPDRENFWKLIGQKGTVIEGSETKDGKLLILFENILDDYGLENHNPIKNSLWIRKSDLTFL